MTRRADPRTARTLVPRAELPDFAPVPRQSNRHDGWTDQRQQDFIHALADTGSVASACKAVDMSTNGAYYLRRQKGAESFREAWEKALDIGVQRLEDVAMDRALNGVDEPVYSYGKLIGSRKKVNDRLLMFMLRNRAPERFGKNGSDLKGLNAIGKMEKRRLKKKWRKKWEKEQATAAAKAKAAASNQKSVQAIRDSIDAKIDRFRAQVERERAREWEQMSEDTRAAWAEFERLRNRDFDRLAADEEFRRRHERGPREHVNCEPFDWRKKPVTKVRKTVHSLKDDGWDETEPEEPSS
ncbi:hypothetical protein INR77_11010 [Erythrobacter sp. SCSIO 43205]|uniref:hypothetical protein n=1 Tax=Erythrobacter sp. SCSIO 43205 TaxID=2779361 RepID=UPI001CA99F99|nr:hypothetical protein [Erythrobacter sp. SCSIO 43205]UAB77337.1 hypothetical protein INR77_11010 [Erythrobacter sp. SCSIO 43205]